VTARGRLRASASRLAAPVGTLVAVGVAWTYVAAVNPNEPGHYPVCPLLRFTGLYCPGCGGLRCAWDLAHGEWRAALGSNALAVAGIALFAAFWILWSVRSAQDRPVGLTPRAAHWWLVGGLALVFTVLRNLPFGTVLAP
jgi:hypothetical protein